MASPNREGLFGVVRNQKACHESVGLSGARKLDRTHHFCFYLVYYGYFTFQTAILICLAVFLLLYPTFQRLKLN